MDDDIDDLLLQFPVLPEEPEGEYVTDHQLSWIVELTEELSRRNFEALKLYQPTSYQERFHRCRAKQCLLQGGNRSGKSLAGFVEDARAVTGQDPYHKYPEKNGVLAIIGADLDHIGTVVYKYLFLPDAFKLIRDLETGQLRTYRPWDPSDRQRKNERLPAPPLIPPRFVEGSIGWHNKALRQFTRVQLVNGWSIKAISSRSEPPQGYKADLGHIDEDLVNESHFGELQSRLVDNEGYLRVTAMPHAENEFITAMNELAEDDDNRGYQDDDPRRTVVRIQVSMLDNPHLDPDAKQTQSRLFMAQGIDVYKQRVEGKLGIESTLMYPTFDKKIHTLPVEAHYGVAYDHPVIHLTDIPRNWCRYLWIDPGYTICAALFIATPPPEFGDFRIVYDELYIHNCTAKILAGRIKAKLVDQTIQAFGIDDHGSRPRDAGGGISIREQYSAAFEQQGVASVQTGSGFLLGSDDVAGRVEMVRAALGVRDSQPPKLLFMNGTTLNCQNEFRRYRRKVIKVQGQKVITDDPVAKHNHLMNCLEYALAHGCAYRRPPNRDGKIKSKAQLMVEAVRKRFRKSVDPRSRDRSITLAPQGDK